MIVLVRNPARLVIAIENQTPVRFLLVTLFDPGALQSVEFFDLVSPGVWGFYLLTRTGNGVSALARGSRSFLRHSRGGNLPPSRWLTGG